MDTTGTGALQTQRAASAPPTQASTERMRDYTRALLMGGAGLAVLLQAQHQGDPRVRTVPKPGLG